MISDDRIRRSSYYNSYLLENSKSVLVVSTLSVLGLFRLLIGSSFLGISNTAVLVVMAGPSVALYSGRMFLSSVMIDI